jgi:hypothetical protein
VRYDVLTAVTMSAVLWDVTPCSLETSQKTEFLSHNQSQSQSHIATDGQSVCLDEGYTVVSMWGALFDERTDLSFVGEISLSDEIARCRTDKAKLLSGGHAACHCIQLP